MRNPYVCLGLLLAPALQAATYEGQGVRASKIDYCFAGSAVTGNPVRIGEIQTLIAEFERAINVKFSYQGACPAPTVLPNGNEDYGSNLRLNISGSGVAIPTAGKIPGKGCTHDLPNSSFAMFPDEAAAHRSCLFNVQIWDDADAAGNRYRNHPLHELGHALGLRHEHIRADAIAASKCEETGFGGSFSDGYLTAYDRFSVMDYAFFSCGIEGNYGNSGLSSNDILGLWVLYPENGSPARYQGNTVAPAGKSIQLYAGWSWLGAAAGTASAYVWTLDGAVGSNQAWQVWQPAVGVHTVKLQYKDLLGRTMLSQFSVNVLSAADYQRKVLTPVVVGPI